MGKDKFKSKFIVKYPIWGLENEKIEPSDQVIEKELSYQQLTRIAKLGKKAMIQDKDGNDVEFGTDMPNILPDIVDDFDDQKPITSFASFIYINGTTPNESDFTISGEIYKTEIEGQTIHFYNIENTTSIRYNKNLKISEININGASNLAALGDNSAGANLNMQPSSIVTFKLIGKHKILNMSRMFEGCASLTDISIDTSNVTDISAMFKDCISLVNIPLLNCSNVTNARDVFSNNTNLVNVAGLDQIRVDLDLSAAKNLSVKSTNDIIRHLGR